LHQSDRDSDPQKLKGLRQAMYVLDCLHEGLGEDSIIDNCDGDSQVVKIWLDFLKDNRWVIRDDNNRWLLTDKGRRQLASYYQI
jgi:predicted transcriptional regulator